MKSNFQNIGVIGAGAWGSALSIALSKKANNVTLWAYEKEVVDEINNHKTNKAFLPDIKFPTNIKVVNNFEEFKNSDIIFIVCPSHNFSNIIKNLASNLNNQDVPIVICTKGIEEKTGKLLHEIVSEFLPNNPVFGLTGPSFAKEVARNMITKINLCGKNNQVANQIINQFSNDNFEIIYHNDIIGAEICGLYKNIIAIACGYYGGLKNSGQNQVAAIITESLQEISILIEKMGGKKETILSLCGIGDLILTCTSKNSRNYSFGYALAEENMQNFNKKMVVEGVHACKIVKKLAEKHNIELKTCNFVHKLINK